MADKTFKSLHGNEFYDMGTAGLIQGRQAPPLHGRTELQTYRFEFGNEEKIYSISFGGRISDAEVRKILEVMHSQPYADCSGAVWTYLEQNKLEYLDFKTGISASRHKDIMSTANILLKSCSCDIIDKQIGGTDNYYVVMDYQKQINACCCEGCYYAVKRMAIKNVYNYHIVGQTFSSGPNDDIQSGYFAIRTGDCQQLHDLDIKNDNLIFPAFGCMDMLGVLLNINAIHTAKDAEKIAVK